MIVFKTEIKEMPISCNYCSFRHICKPELNLSPRDTKQIIPFLEYCPLIKIPDPKPEPTLTQHEHDLIQIIKKVHPDITHMGITKHDDSIYILTDVKTEKPLLVGGVRRYLYKEKIIINLFDKYKFPTLLSEFTNETSEKQYNINSLLSRSIRKE